MCLTVFVSDFFSFSLVQYIRKRFWESVQWLQKREGEREGGREGEREIMLVYVLDTPIYVSNCICF